MEHVVQRVVALVVQLVVYVSALSNEEGASIKIHQNSNVENQNTFFCQLPVCGDVEVRFSKRTEPHGATMAYRNY